MTRSSKRINGDAQKLGLSVISMVAVGCLYFGFLLGNIPFMSSILKKTMTPAEAKINHTPEISEFSFYCHGSFWRYQYFYNPKYYCSFHDKINHIIKKTVGKKMHNYQFHDDEICSIHFWLKFLLHFLQWFYEHLHNFLLLRDST